MAVSSHLTVVMREMCAAYGKRNTLADCRDLLVNLCESRAAADYVNGELEQIAAGASMSATASGDGQSFLLARAPGLSLSLHLVQSTRAPSKVCGTIEDRLVTPCGDEPVVLNLWAQPRPDPIDVFQPERALREPRQLVLHRGETAMLRAARDIAHIAADGPAPLLVLGTPSAYPLVWEYDAATGRPNRMIAGSPVSSRLEYTSLILAEMGYQPAIPQLTQLCHHTDHAVRWAAIRAVTHLDRAQGVDLLQDATSDPHPQLRTAAARVLATLAGTEG